MSPVGYDVVQTCTQQKCHGYNYHYLEERSVCLIWQHAVHGMARDKRKRQIYQRCNKRTRQVKRKKPSVGFKVRNKRFQDRLIVVFHFAPFV